MVEVRVRWCTCSLCRMLCKTLGKLIHLLLSSLPLLVLLSVNVHTKITRIELAMGTIFLVIEDVTLFCTYLKKKIAVHIQWTL